MAVRAQVFAGICHICYHVRYCRNNWPFTMPLPRTTTVQSYVNNHNYAQGALSRFPEKLIYQNGVLMVPANLAANTKKEERCQMWIKQCGKPCEQLKPSKLIGTPLFVRAATDFLNNSTWALVCTFSAYVPCMQFKFPWILYFFCSKVR